MTSGAAASLRKDATFAEVAVMFIRLLLSVNFHKSASEDPAHQYQFKISQGPAAIITAPNVPPIQVTQITIAGTIVGSSA